MEITKGFIKTEIGLIPKDWKILELNSLGDYPFPPIKAGPFGSNLKKDMYVKSGFKVYGQEQVIRGDIHYGDYYITEIKYKELESCSVKPGDILLSLVGTLGKLLVIPNDAPKGIINPRLIRFSFSKKLISPCFFKFLFESQRNQSLLSNKAQGGTMGVLNAGILKSFKIALPSKPEQDLIGIALSDAEELIESIEKLIEKKNHLMIGVMSALLSGKKRLPGFNDLWELKQLGHSIEIRKGQLITEKTAIKGDIPVIAGGIKHSYYHNRPNRKENVITISASGANAGFVSFHPYKIFASDCSTIEESNTFDIKFLYFILKSRQSEIYKLQTGGAQPHVYPEHLKSIDLFFPKIEEQIAISTVINNMEQEISALESKLHKTKQMKVGMMQELLSGRIRLSSKNRLA